MHKTNPPPQQLSILNRCFHPTGTFVEFKKDEIEQSIPDRFEQQVRKYPNRIAIKTHGDALTYDELNKAANRVAQRVLIPRGEEPELVALLLEEEIPLITAALGILKAGKFYVPLDSSFPRARLSDMLEDSQAKVIVTNTQSLSLARELASDGCKLINIDTIDSVSSAENPGLPIAPDALAYILYTSGSTGRPKGVVQNHRNLLYFTMNSTNAFHICPNDGITLLSSFSGSAGATSIFSALLNGATLFPFDFKGEGVGKLANWLIRERITIYISSPTLFRHFVSNLSELKGFPNLRIIRLASEPVLKSDVDLCKKYFSQDCILVNWLGSTEGWGWRRYFVDKDTRITENTVPVGYGVDGMDVLLLDETHKEVGSNQVGEIAVKSRYVSPGYWRRPDITQAAFLMDPDGGDQRIYLTGDMGRMMPDGCLEHLGRKDFQVQVRGNRVEIAEVESTLLDHGAVQAAVVVGLEEPQGGQKLVAYVVSSEQRSPTASDLRRALRTRLPDFMVPSAFVFLDALPFLPSGKIDRNALPQPAYGRPDLETPFVGPRSVIEEVLADIWSQVLEVDRVGCNDDFLDLGGDSLLATALLAHVEESFQKKLPLAALIEASTVAQMAKILRDERWRSSGSCLVPIQSKGDKPPFFCIHGLGGHVLGMAALARHLGEDQPFYGLESAGRDGEQPPLTEIEAMAARYISEIQTVQPEGPYLLGGYSMGGVIAFEMAQQLHAEGREVGLLAIFDSECPVRTSGWRRRSVFTKIRNSPDLLRRNPETQRWFISEKFGTYVKRNKGFSPVEAPNSRAVSSYKPNPYPGKITFFWASERPEGPSDSRWDWGELAEQGMDIHRVPGDHGTILREPDLQVLAERLKDCLDRTLPS